MTAADQASQALLDQVFVDGAQGNFDSDPVGTIADCFQGFPDACFFWTPYDLGVGGSNVTLSGAQNFGSTAGLTFSFVA